jgi:hypothetical protein
MKPFTPPYDNLETNSSNIHEATAKKVSEAIEEFLGKCEDEGKENLQRVLDINPQAINYLSQCIRPLALILQPSLVIG